MGLSYLVLRCPWGERDDHDSAFHLGGPGFPRPFSALYVEFPPLVCCAAIACPPSLPHRAVFSAIHACFSDQSLWNPLWHGHHSGTCGNRLSLGVSHSRSTVCIHQPVSLCTWDMYLRFGGLLLPLDAHPLSIYSLQSTWLSGHGELSNQWCPGKNKRRKNSF